MSLRSPNENLPMDKDKDDTDKGRKNLARPKDPRKSNKHYADNSNMIIERSSTARQFRNDAYDNVSGSEDSNDEARLLQQVSQQSRPSFDASESADGRNRLRTSQINNNSRGRTSYPILDIEESLYSIIVQQVPEALVPPLLIPNSQNVQNQVPLNSSGFLQPPPPPPILPGGQSLPQAAIPIPIQSPAPVFAQSHISPDILQPIGASRSSTENLQSPSITPASTSSPIMSPPQDSSAALSNPNYYGSTLRAEHSGTPFESSQYHLKTNVYGRLYQNFKNANLGDKILHSNVVKGLKNLTYEWKYLYDELSKREVDLAEKDKVIENKKNTIIGLKDLKEKADTKARKAIEERDAFEEKAKNAKKDAEMKEVRLVLQNELLDNTKKRNEKLLSENNSLKESIASTKKSHDDEIKKLEVQLKVEQDANAALKEELAQVKEEASKSEKETKRYRAKKKEAEAEIIRIKTELKDAKDENDKKEQQIRNLEGDQKVLTRSNKELTEQRINAENRLKELEESVVKEKEAAKEEGKAEGKLEAEAEFKPIIDNCNRKAEALKLLFQASNVVEILSKKRKIRQQPAAVNHTVSDVGPSAAKRRRIDTDLPNTRPRSNPPAAIITSEPILTQPPPIRATSASNRVADGTLFTNNGLGTFLQQSRANQPSTPVNNVSVYPPQRPPANYDHPTMPNAQASFPQALDPSFKALESQAGDVLQRCHNVTDDTARECIRNLEPQIQDLLRRYTEILVINKHTSHANPIIQRLMYEYQQHILQQQLQQQQIQAQQQVRRVDDRSFSNSGSLRNRNAGASTQPTQNPMNQVPPSHLQQQQRLGAQPTQSLRSGFQPSPQVQQQQQQTPPIQQHILRPPVSANAPNSSPHLAQALNRRSSNSTVTNADDTDIERLVDMCRPRVREINGYVRRRFNIPLGDNVYYRDASRLDQTFRTTYPYVVRR